MDRASRVPYKNDRGPIFPSTARASQVSIKQFIMALGSFFQTLFRSVKFKGVPARDDASNLERTSYHDSQLEKKLLTSSEHFTIVSYGFHFWIRSQSVGITFTSIQVFQVQLDWSHRNLSLPIEHLFGIRFRQSAKWLSLHLRFALQYQFSFRFSNLWFQYVE